MKFTKTKLCKAIDNGMFDSADLYELIQRLLSNRLDAAQVTISDLYPQKQEIMRYTKPEILEAIRTLDWFEDVESFELELEDCQKGEGDVLV